MLSKISDKMQKVLPMYWMIWKIRDNQLVYSCCGCNHTLTHSQSTEKWTFYLRPLPSEICHVRQTQLLNNKLSKRCFSRRKFPGPWPKISFHSFVGFGCLQEKLAGLRNRERQLQSILEMKCFECSIFHVAAIPTSFHSDYIKKYIYNWKNKDLCWRNSVKADTSHVNISFLNRNICFACKQVSTKNG